MLQQHICGETKAKLKENKVSEVVKKMNTVPYPKSVVIKCVCGCPNGLIADRDTNCPCDCHKQEPSGYEDSVMGRRLLGKGDKLSCDKCTNCENEVEGVDDDGYCEDCVIEIGISHAEANNDRD